MNRRRLLQSGIPEGFVDLGLPSGLLWAQGNIVKNGNKYSIGEETDYGTYFSWGNVDGHNDDEGYLFTETAYNSSPGRSLTADIAPNDAAHDAALARLGSPWHLPTKENFQELLDYTDREWTTINGVAGWKFMKKTDHSVYAFFPAAGYIDHYALRSRGSMGVYWSSTFDTYVGGDDYAYYLDYDMFDAFLQTNYFYRGFGFSVRPVISGDGTYRFTFNSYMIYVYDNDSRPHTSFTPNTDIWVVLHNPDYDNTSYMVIGEFKAGVSYPVLTQDRSRYYLIDDTNKEIIISDSNLVIDD